MTLRWQVAGVDCELRMNGTAKRVSVRRDGVIVGSATVESAADAHEWASELADSLQEKSDRRTGTD